MFHHEGREEHEGKIVWPQRGNRRKVLLRGLRELRGEEKIKRIATKATV
jgi:hypothetical protein